MKITVLFPTQTEASLFQRDDVNAIISGVGLSATAYATTKLICQSQNKPDLLIMAGIAGAYPHSGLKIGDVTLVATEVEGDLGFFTTSGFVHLAHLPIDMEFERRHTLACPHIPAKPLFPLAHSMSLNAAMAPFVNTGEVDLENMEGAAFFHTCLQENQAFLELRAISNFVNIHNDEWDMQASVKAMTAGLHRLIDSLLQSKQ